MDNIKISLTVILPGSVMVSKEESLKQLTKQVKKNGKPVFKDGKPVTEEVTVYDYATNDKTTMLLQVGREKETIEVFTRKSKPAKQVMNLSQEAYDQFTGDFIPAKFKGNWKTMTPNQKVKWHCENIAESFGGKLESFKVFD